MFSIKVENCQECSKCLLSDYVLRNIYAMNNLNILWPQHLKFCFISCFTFYNLCNHQFSFTFVNQTTSLVSYNLSSITPVFFYFCIQTTSLVSYNPSSITPEEYFNELIDLQDRDIGRPIEQTTKVQKFKASLWLCEDFPLSLQEQVIPIIDLMATSNAHFAKLRDFITLQLPSGFPVKIGECVFL